MRTPRHHHTPLTQPATNDRTARSTTTASQPDHPTLAPPRSGQPATATGHAPATVEAATGHHTSGHRRPHRAATGQRPRRPVSALPDRGRS